jgi:hypothetical protein
MHQLGLRLRHEHGYGHVLLLYVLYQRAAGAENKFLG